MKTQFFLVVNDGDGGSVRTVKSRPDLKWNEIALHINLELPQKLFQKPQLNTSIIVSDEQISPTEIDVETSDNIKQAIESATGLEVRLEILDRDSD